MKSTTPQRYKSEGIKRGIDYSVLDPAVEAIRKIKAVDTRLFPLLTLYHLSEECSIPYGYLRKIIGRKMHGYEHFYLKKRVPGRSSVRMISTPHDPLLNCQKWIAQNILKNASVHDSSHAYHPNSSPVFAAQAHPNSKWLIKVDIQDFFHAISEHKVYEVFHSLGYSRLLSFELARLCTMMCEKHPGHSDPKAVMSKYDIKYYRSETVGVLPQGAPTSPMLSNFAMRETDTRLERLAKNTSMRFTRYADDIVFSCKDNRGRADLEKIKKRILEVLNKAGFRPNLRKTTIRGPGNRLIVLGMLVSGERPRLTREYKDDLDLQLHYLTHPDYGPAEHAKDRNSSTSKIHNRVLGLIFWAKAVEPELGEQYLELFNTIDWPAVTKKFYIW